MLTKLRFGLPVIKEKVAEPDLSQVCLVLICRVNFFHCVKLLCFEVETFPYLGEPTTAKLFSTQVPFDECFVLEYCLVVCSFECWLPVHRCNIFIAISFIACLALILDSFAGESANRGIVLVV